MDLIEFKKVFSPGASVTIIADREGNSAEYRTCVEEMGEEKLILQAPLQSGKFVRLPTGGLLVLQLIQEGKVFCCEVRVLRHRWNAEDGQGGRYLVVETTLPAEIRSRRRRGYFRVPVELELEIDGKRGKVVNISGNGILAVVDRGIVEEAGEKAIKLFLPGEELPLQFTACAVRTEVIPGKQEKTRAAFHFAKLDEKQRDAIVQYALRIQRKLIRAGLLEERQ